MSHGLLFWILMVIWLLFGMVWRYSGLPHGPLGSNLLLFILLLLLGWQAFGAPIR